jgi:hypothetical protein
VPGLLPLRARSHASGTPTVANRRPFWSCGTAFRRQAANQAPRCIRYGLFAGFPNRAAATLNADCWRFYGLAQVAGAPETLVGVPLACDRRRSRRKPAGVFLLGKTRCPGYCRFAPDRTQAVLLQWLIAGLVGAAVRLRTRRRGVSGAATAQASPGCRTAAPTGFVGHP